MRYKVKFYRRGDVRVRTFGSVDDLTDAQVAADKLVASGKAFYSWIEDTTRTSPTERATVYEAGSIADL